MNARIVPAQENRPPNKALKAAMIAAPFILVLAIIMLLMLPSTDCSTSHNDGCVYVLFLGNSYTYVNDLPATFAKLAKSGGHQVMTGMLAEGGWSLEDHVQSAKTVETMQSRQWDFIVLQEQSITPALDPYRANKMYPFARTLVRQIRKVNAAPLFFETWAHQHGEPDYDLPDYGTMQARINEGYRNIGRELNVSVVPVGDAWYTAIQQNPSLALWQSDGSHPTKMGTYLAACVFYAAIFQESPQGLRYTAGIPKETAQALQAVAGKYILRSPK